MAPLTSLRLSVTSTFPPPADGQLTFEPKVMLFKEECEPSSSSCVFMNSSIKFLFL